MGIQSPSQQRSGREEDKFAHTTQSCSAGVVFGRSPVCVCVCVLLAGVAPCAIVRQCVVASAEERSRVPAAPSFGAGAWVFLGLSEGAGSTVVLACKSTPTASSRWWWDGSVPAASTHYMFVFWGVAAGGVGYAWSMQAQLDRRDEGWKAHLCVFRRNAGSRGVTEAEVSGGPVLDRPRGFCRKGI